MSRYVLFAILTLIAILTLRGVGIGLGLGEDLDDDNDNDIPPVSRDYTPGVDDGAFSLDQAGNNVRRLASQNNELTQVQDDFDLPPDEQGDENRQGLDDDFTDPPPRADQEPIPALW